MLSTSFINKRRRIANKIWAINKKGGKCVKCGEDNIWKLAFHHISKDKLYTISKILDRNYNREVLEDELEKCELMCINCHREEHFYKTENKRSYNFKTKCLEYKQDNNFHCEHPEHNDYKFYDNISTLDFHHKNSDTEKKLFTLSSKGDRTYNQGITDEIKRELDKCSIYCGNCHNYEHQSNSVDFYNKYKDDVDKFINNYKSLGSREEQLYNRKNVIEYIKKLHDDKKSKNYIIADVVRTFKLKYNTVQKYYIKLYPEEKRKFLDKNWIINQLNKGVSTQSIADQLGYKSNRYIRNIRNSMKPVLSENKYIKSFESFLVKLR